MAVSAAKANAANAGETSAPTTKTKAPRGDGALQLHQTKRVRFLAAFFYLVGY